MLSDCGKSLARVLGGRIEAERQMKSLNARIKGAYGLWAGGQLEKEQYYACTLPISKASNTNAHLRATDSGFSQA